MSIYLPPTVDAVILWFPPSAQSRGRKFRFRPDQVDALQVWLKALKRRRHLVRDRDVAAAWPIALFTQRGERWKRERLSEVCYIADALERGVTWFPVE